MNKEELIYLLNKYHIKPRRQSGQNFLVSDKITAQLIGAANLQKDDTVLEIGPGFGAVTIELCKKAKRVVAVEQDRNFLLVLQKIQSRKRTCAFRTDKNLEIINSDIFKVDFSKLNLGKYKIISSLPYNITSLFFRYFLENEFRPELISVIIQKEVGQRIIAKAGQHSLLSLSVQLFGDPEIIAVVDKNNFYPAPEVDSAITVIKDIHPPKEINDTKKFFQLLRIGFSAKRKKISNNLQNGLKIDKKIIENILKELNFSLNCRAQELTLADWISLFDRLGKFVL